MAMSDLKNVLRIFQGTEPSGDERKELFKEALLMTLARATSSDTNIKPIEVETVQEVICRELDANVSTADIRVAAASGLFETTPLDKYLTKVGRKLSADQRFAIMRCLAEIIKSDLRVSPFEVEFFDMVAKAMEMAPAELAGLKSDD